MINVDEFFGNLVDFDGKYRAGFSYEDFYSECEKFSALDFDRPADAAYATIFARLYRNALRSAVKGDIKDIDSDQMLKDFEEQLMAPYREKCKAQGEEDVSLPYGGKSRAKFLESMLEYAKAAPTNLADFYAEQYDIGRTNLKELRTLAEDHNRDDDRQVSMVANCIAGLDKLHASRSFGWKLTHLIQNFNEYWDLRHMKRVANYDSIKHLVDDGTGVIEAETKNLEKLIKAEKINDTTPIEREKFGDARESLTEEEIALFEEESFYEESELVDDKDELNISKTSSL